MDEFLDFYQRVKKFTWSLEIYHSSIADWCITIGYKTTHEKHGETIMHVHDCDMHLAFAKAQVQLKEWFIENEGGY